MSLADIKERVIGEFKSSFDRFKESSLYTNTKDRYDSLNPLGQKAILIAVIIGLGYGIFSLPYSYFESSSENMTVFRNKRALLRDLLKVSHEMSAGVDIPTPPSADMVRGRLEEFLRSANLQDSQKAPVDMINDNSKLIPSNLASGVFRVNLKLLNLDQILDLAYQIQSISSGVKLKDMSLEANPTNPKYFDVQFKVAVLAAPKIAIHPSAKLPVPNKPGKSGKPSIQEEEEN